MKLKSLGEDVDLKAGVEKATLANYRATHAAALPDGCDHDYSEPWQGQFGQCKKCGTYNPNPMPACGSPNCPGCVNCGRGQSTEAVRIDAKIRAVFEARRLQEVSDKYVMIFLGSNEWGNEAMEKVAMEYFAANSDVDFVEVYEHAGWYLGFRRDGSIWSTANDAAIMDKGPRPTGGVMRSVRRESKNEDYGNRFDTLNTFPVGCVCGHVFNDHYPPGCRCGHVFNDRYPPGQDSWLRGAAEGYCNNCDCTAYQRANEAKSIAAAVDALFEDDGQLLGRWQSKSGKHWVELIKYDKSYGYRAPGAGGNFGEMSSDADAFAALEKKIESGYFLPDAAKTPMTRVK